MRAAGPQPAAGSRDQLLLKGQTRLLLKGQTLLLLTPTFSDAPHTPSHPSKGPASLAAQTHFPGVPLLRSQTGAPVPHS